MAAIVSGSTIDGASPPRQPLYLAQPPLDNHGRPKIQRVFIANRGEIACRVVSTCRKLNLTSIAVYVDEDVQSTHVRYADEAINLGSIARSDRNPFLDIKLLVATAVSAHADAVHPGYGYVSESAEFADAVRDAGLVFIGPTANAMSTLGDKRSAKAYLREKAPEVPLIPGFSGASQSIADLESAANEIGYPIMLKASAGGGGKGMRIVREAAQLRDALERARSEAQRSFGSDDVILEKYIEAGKHVEIQIVGDTHGKVVSFLERDCSVQRRHQKVIEETPCTWLSPALRKDISQTAVSIAELIGYQGAGTVEFVLDVKTSKFYFLEVNARLQVEHPITEEVTGYDMVALQLFVAAGGSLASIIAPGPVQQRGHAIECRLCAEDPQNDFFPEHGTVRIWKPFGIDDGEANVRHETAIATGNDVSIYFDSMIAKVVVWAPTRPEAIQKMIRVLANSVCAGVKTNQLFLQNCLAHAAFYDPGYTTSFIPTNLQSLLSAGNAKNEKLQQMLSLLPNQFIEFQRKTAKRHFNGIRAGFRNQPRGAVSSSTIIVSRVHADQLDNGAAEPAACVCISANSSSASNAGPTVRMALLDTTSPEPTNNGRSEQSASAAQKLTAQYNRLSTMIRENDNDQFEDYDVVMNRCIPDDGLQADSSSWNTFTVDVSINNVKFAASLAIDSEAGHSTNQRPNLPVDIIIHYPLLGTWVQYRCDSLLSYAGNLRQSAAGDQNAQSNIIKAPMPCKVITILKQNGDEVKAGENVMVVESMKMEMNISMSVGGAFKTSLSVGSAVDEGTILCQVE